MYTNYFGLNENPFSIAPDPLYLFMSERHREALAHLQYGIRSDGGFVLLTGEVGAGKTTLCRSLLEKLPADVDIAFILNPKVSVIELLETICDELRISRPAQGSIKQLVDCLNHYLLESNASGRRTVLIIDEAQNLSIDVLEQLRLLTNLETNRYKLLQIVLLGQPELLQILGRQDMRQLSQRITARFHLGPLAASEIGAYVQHRLKIAGCQRPLIPETLAKLLWQITGGVPRLINLVCDRALLGAYARGKQAVDGAIMQQAAREVLGEPRPRRVVSPALLTTALAGVALVLAGTGFWSWQEGQQASTVAVPEAVRTVPSGDSLPVQGMSTQNEVTAINAAPLVVPLPEAELPAAEVPARPLPQTWPPGFAMGQSQDKAFTDLAKLWGYPDLNEREGSCVLVRELGLECLERQDSLETLRQINRPAVLTLYDDDGLPFHVLMARLDGDRALFVAGDEQYELSLAAISSRWFGDYLMLWQRPPIKQIILRPAERGEAVVWLAEMLESLGYYTATGQEGALEGKLLGAFKRFQFSNGLTPDGVLGPMSLIYLNNALHREGPRLVMQGVS